jgi:serine/threonine-protein kinase RsbW
MTVVADNSVEELSLIAHANEVRRASAWLEAACMARNAPQDQIDRLTLCLNEALANIITHGGENALASPINLSLTVNQDQTSRILALTISDAGIEFDPFSAPIKPAPKELAQAEIGGLGVIMMRSLTDKQIYRYDNGRNCSTFLVRVTQSETPAISACAILRE